MKVYINNCVIYDINISDFRLQNLNEIRLKSIKKERRY
jgi:hypothetical protein